MQPNICDVKAGLVWPAIAVAPSPYILFAVSCNFTFIVYVCPAVNPDVVKVATISVSNPGIFVQSTGSSTQDGHTLYLFTI